eukprot:TRINITY_DN43222_c0_g1_i1.p1 TRINITY_DN43222_c0_g1~~TRINITY_DN43222_c0_g1_i1.p1  ORF type:complete len:111 (-),score=8.62 TRINITY_DN43222_c0_g1_i1:137-469(-)
MGGCCLQRDNQNKFAKPVGTSLQSPPTPPRPTIGQMRLCGKGIMHSPSSLEAGLIDKKKVEVRKLHLLNQPQPFSELRREEGKNDHEDGGETKDESVEDEFDKGDEGGED